MNKTQQLLRNLRREILYLATSANDNSNKTRRITELFEVAECASKSSKQGNCMTCTRAFSCANMTRWNNISDKELARKS